MDTKDKLEIALQIWSNLLMTASLILSIKKTAPKKPHKQKRKR